VCFFAVLAAQVLSACSSIDLGEARSLANSGVRASSALSDDTALAHREFALSGERSALLNALAGGSGDSNPANEAKRKQIMELLATRAAAMRDLAATYRAFHELVTLDVAGETRAAAMKLVGSTNAFITAANKATGSGIGTVSAGAGSFVGVGLALIAEERLKREAGEVNTVLRAAVSGLHDALEAESQYATSVRKDALLRKSALRVAWLDLGVASYEQIVPDLTALADIRPVKDIDAVLRAKPQLRRKLEVYLNGKAMRDAARVDDSYMALLGALKALAAEHGKLEKGKPLDIAAIMEWVNKLIAIYEAAKAADGAAASQGAK
jgi:hypothetical protein